MPIFEYVCKVCDHQFEALIRSKTIPKCPTCDSADLEKLLSVPGIKSESTRQLSMRAAKKRDAAQAKDRMHDRMTYERSHDRHG